MSSQALQVVESPPQEVLTLSSTELIQRRSLILDVMRTVMQEGVHYGVIPGVERKMLFKPGADLLCNVFRLAPRYVITRHDLANGHREYEIVTNLTHAVTEQFWGSGLGSCSTMESKYRWRKAGRTCPECGVDAIRKSKPEWGGGWYCSDRDGGCTAKFRANDAAIIAQDTGRVENPDIGDQWNTILKMAKKRSQADAVITATGAADMFTHPAPEEEEHEDAEQQERAPRPPQPTRPPQSQGPTQVVSQQQIGFLMGVSKQFGVTEDQLHTYLATLGIASRKDIPKNKLDSILEWVKGQKKENAE